MFCAPPRRRRRELRCQNKRASELILAAKRRHAQSFARLQCAALFAPAAALFVQCRAVPSNAKPRATNRFAARAGQINSTRLQSQPPPPPPRRAYAARRRQGALIEPDGRLIEQSGCAPPTPPHLPQTCRLFPARAGSARAEMKSAGGQMQSDAMEVAAAAAAAAVYFHNSQLTGLAATVATRWRHTRRPLPPPRSGARVRPAAIFHKLARQDFLICLVSAATAPLLCASRRRLGLRKQKAARRETTSK